MKYNDRLEEIISRYGFKAPELASSTEINNIIADAIMKRCAGKNASIWGVGKNNSINSHAAVILDRFALNLMGLKYLIDSSEDLQGGKFMGYPIIAPSQIKEKGIEIVIIASRASGASIRESLQKAAPGCEYLDIYEELRKNGIVIDYNFFSEQNIYTRLYEAKKRYEEAGVDGQEPLRELIAYYLKIRDFYYARRYADEYLTAGFEGGRQLEDMMREIDALCGEVCAANAGRKDSVFVHLIDSLRALDVYSREEGEPLSLNMFRSFEKNAVIFENAFSTGPTTFESMLGTVKQKLSFEENVYEDNRFMFHYEDFELLEDMRRQGRRIIFYTARDYLIMYPSEQIELKEQLHMTEKLWQAACDMAESKEPVFGFLYYPWELHFPLLCGYMRNKPVIRHFSDVGLEDMSGFIESQFEDCKAYTDMEFEFYKPFFGEESTWVFLGDHSQPVYGGRKEWPFYMYYRDYDRVSHVAFMICNSRLQKSVYKELVSMLDFNKIVKEAVINGRIVIPDRKVIQYQYYKIQNKKLRDAAERYGYWDYTEGIQCFLSEKYLFVITGTGKKEVYRVEDRENDIADTPEGKEFADYIEAEYDTSFPDFWDVNKGV